MVARIGEIEDVNEERIQASVNKSTQNTHEVSDYLSYGIDALPEKGAKVVLLSLREKAHKIFIGVKRKLIDRKSKPGETRLYSKTGAQVYLDENDQIIIQTAGGAILTMKQDGTIELDGNQKSAITFEEFETVWNSFIAKYEAHTHTTIALGVPTSTVIVPLVTTDKDMTPAKSTKVKIGQN